VPTVREITGDWIMRNGGWIAATAVCAAFVGGYVVRAQDKGAPAASERKVKEAEVPAAALAALKKQAGGAAITEFAEEIEHGGKFYEGSWKGPDGAVDVLVTQAGDLVEIEESVPADKVPAAVRAALEKSAGKDSGATWERKTYIAYEAHYKKDGKGQETLFLPDGRTHSEEDEKGEGDKDEDGK
jgi:hypothetical protein